MRVRVCCRATQEMDTGNGQETHTKVILIKVYQEFCVFLCVYLRVCVMPQLFDPKCSDKAYVPAIYIAHKQTCPHIYIHTHKHIGIRSVCVMNMCTSHRLNSVGLCQKQFKQKTENH